MPRVARIVIPGCPHHVTQRGNNRQDVFFVDDDFRVYLRLLARQSRRFGLMVDFYCLMPNHVHLIATPREEDSLAKALGLTHTLYTQYINRTHGRCGHLWQNRFYSCPMDDEHCWAAAAYVERNPLRAGLAGLAWEYRWSSAAAHCGLPDVEPAGRALLDLDAWQRRLPPDGDWRDALSRPGDEAETRRIRLATARGRPLADDSMIAKLEVALNRRLRPLRVGRPKKAK